MDDSKEDKEAFSDLEIGDSDEEILNKINPNENEEEGQLQVWLYLFLFLLKTKYNHRFSLGKLISNK